MSARGGAYLQGGGAGETATERNGGVAGDLEADLGEVVGLDVLGNNALGMAATGEQIP